MPVSAYILQTDGLFVITLFYVVLSSARFRKTAGIKLLQRDRDPDQRFKEMLENKSDILQY